MSDPQHDVKQWLAAKLEPRGVKAAFGKAIGMTPDKVTRSIELESPDPKKRRALKLEEIEASARYFNELPPGFNGMTQWLNAASSSSARPRPTPNASFPPVYQKFPSDSYIPVLGQTAGGPNGRFVLNGAEVGRVFTPPALEGVEGAYAVRVFGTSMHPRFKPGETVWINPHLPVRQGDDCVVQMKTDEVDGRESYIKEFVSRSAGALRLWQHNPDEGEENEISLDNSKVLAVHKVVFQAML
ncbi:S24 family peptidase [Rhizobium leguminosarum]|uniref:S24 family peptidase n=1 Tax=Rhizobium leguminosarum TaxID=384 RepID=UPI0013B692E4|nr:S24 family peptidase [Rhizobium leguminosarum]NEH72315.1 helix-turn-helix transcriptional regulator [Rhizobium leguminosarum]